MEVLGELIIWVRCSKVWSKNQDRLRNPSVDKDRDIKSIPVAWRRITAFGAGTGLGKGVKALRGTG